MSEPFGQPDAIIKRIEDHSIESDAPFWVRVDALMRSAFDAHGDIDESGDAELLRETSAGRALETAARRTGFILGVEYCRDLMRSGGVH